MTIELEQICRPNQSHWRTQHQSLSEFISVVLLLALLFCAAANSCNCEFDKLFVFGDSYVDTGNRDPKNNTYTATGRVNQNWEPPYGRTYPGVPAGRFSDGKVLSDYLGDYMGLKPCPFRLLKTLPTSTQCVKDGINFAVSGSGVFNNLGFTKTGDQSNQLKGVLNTKLYPKSICKTAIILYAISGNDYGAYKRNNGSAATIIQFVQSVVSQVSKDLRALYDMGFRSFVVGKLPPLGCLPYVTVINNFTSCDEEFNNIATFHNLKLVGSVSTTLPKGDVIFLNNRLAFVKAIYTLSNSGNQIPAIYDLSISGRLKPCCSGVQMGALCGDVNKTGQVLYTVCSFKSLGSYFWWDEYHPTDASWGSIFHLFLEGFPFRYTDGKSLAHFLGVNGSTRPDYGTNS